MHKFKIKKIDEIPGDKAPQYVGNFLHMSVNYANALFGEPNKMESADGKATYIYNLEIKDDRGNTVYVKLYIWKGRKIINPDGLSEFNISLVHSDDLKMASFAFNSYGIPVDGVPLLCKSYFESVGGEYSEDGYTTVVKFKDFKFNDFVMEYNEFENSWTYLDCRNRVYGLQTVKQLDELLHFLRQTINYNG